MVAPVIKQSWVLSSALVNVLGQGLILSYPTSLLPALRAPDSPIEADLATASWLASANFQSSIVGFMISPFFMEIYGRRSAFILGLTPSIIGWFLICFTPNIATLLVGRLLTGVTGGATATLGAMIVGEYSSPQYRGLFLGLKTAGTCVGSMIGHVLANYFDWRIFALIALFTQTVSLTIAYTWPESPLWLLSQNNFEECKQSFYWLRGKSAESKIELDEMFRAQKERMAKVKEKSRLDSFLQFFINFTKGDFIRPTSVIFMTCLMMEMTGRHVFPGFFVEIIGGIIGNSKSFSYTFSIDLIITASAFCSTFFVKSIKRRTLLFSCGFAALSFLLLLCIYLFLVDKHIILGNSTWAPLFLFATYLILVNIGCAPLHIVVLGEIYPLTHKGAGSILSGFISWLISSTLIKATPYMFSSFKIYGTFTVLGTGMAISLIALIFILPETKDKTLQEIEDYFVKNDNYGKYSRIEDINVATKTI